MTNTSFWLLIRFIIQAKTECSGCVRSKMGKIITYTTKSKVDFMVALTYILMLGANTTYAKVLPGSCA